MVHTNTICWRWGKINILAKLFQTVALKSFGKASLHYLATSHSLKLPRPVQIPSFISFSVPFVGYNMTVCLNTQFMQSKINC